jgi:hypothetical protein
VQTLIAFVYFVLALFGCDLGSHTSIDRIRVGGVDTLYSKVVAQPVVTRFECRRSASGQCYYTLFPRDCTPASVSAPGPTGARTADCLSRPVERFALAAGGSRQIPALPRFRLCVSAEAQLTGPDCDMPKPMAAR